MISGSRIELFIYCYKLLHIKYTDIEGAGIFYSKLFKKSNFLLELLSVISTGIEECDCQYLLHV